MHPESNSRPGRAGNALLLVMTLVLLAGLCFPGVRALVLQGVPARRVAVGPIDHAPGQPAIHFKEYYDAPGTTIEASFSIVPGEEGSGGVVFETGGSKAGLRLEMVRPDLLLFRFGSRDIRQSMPYELPVRLTAGEPYPLSVRWGSDGRISISSGEQSLMRGRFVGGHALVSDISVGGDALARDPFRGQIRQFRLAWAVERTWVVDMLAIGLAVASMALLVRLWPGLRQEVPLLAVAVLFLHAATTLGPGRMFSEHDTVRVVESADKILSCLRGGVLSGCEVPYFPLFQYLASTLMRAGGASLTAIYAVFSHGSFLALAAIAILFHRLLRHDRTLLHAGLLILVTGPYWVYARTTFNELVAGFLALAYLFLCLRKAWPPLIAASFVLAGTTKEIAAPFLLLIGCVAMAPEMVTRPREHRRELTLLAVSALLAMGVNAGFNLFRYGTLHNGPLLASENIVPTLELQAGFAMAIWFSLAGGLLVFWPTFSFFSLAAIGASLHRLARRRMSLAQALPAVACLLILAGLTTGFAKWWSPFGWDAYGQRLILPWLPAVLAMLLALCPGPCRDILSRLTRSRLFPVLGMVVIVFSTVHYLSFLDPAFRWRAWYDGARRGIAEHYNPDADPAHTAVYYRNVNATLRDRDSFMLYEYRVSLRNPNLWPGVALHAAVTALLLRRLRREATSPPPAAESAS